MSFKAIVTKSQIMKGYPVVISIGYCNLQNLLYYEIPRYYTIRLEGWGCDVYEINNCVAIATGYAPFGNVKPDYDIVRSYDDKARNVLYNAPWDTRKAELNKLLTAFINEVVPE